MEAFDFSKTKNTFILSDIHLTTAEPVNAKDPLWRKFKTREFFIDDAFDLFLEEIQKKCPNESIELILAGDIFDFDGVTQLPSKHRFITSWLERARGLNSEERKSRFKIDQIIKDHPIFFNALKRFVKNKNRIIFVIGNHDLELHWPSVQQKVFKAMNLTAEEEELVRFNNWFYISNNDTLIEHGNQYDSHSNCQNPINPKIQGYRKERIRLPFGCLANRYMLNGMGYFNPHSDRTYILTFKEYLLFASTHLIRKEPLLLWTWFWGAIVTLFETVKEGLTPEVKDPFRIEDQVEQIAKNANATPRMVRELKEIHAHPSFTDPIGVARELWLDRAFVILFAFFIGWQFLNLINFVWRVSYWWLVAIFMLLMPFFIFYYRSFQSKVIIPLKHYERAIRLASKISRVQRVVFGHTHVFVHTNFEGIEYLNSGTWSPAFDDIACTIPTCPKTFVWIRTDTDSTKRVANVYEWRGNNMHLLC